ncbi:MAG TPA: TIM barrel protein [Chthonomonadaceae bacterium]|nr:TIM barrel protein [Chthonomonadaceae bacterium]
MPNLGPHIDPPLSRIPSLLAAHGWATFQTTLRDPHRLSKESIPDEGDQALFLLEAKSLPGLWGMVHASMLTNLASPDPRIRHGSAGALAADANLAADLGLAGVCFHVGYQKGHADREAALAAVGEKLREVLGRLKAGARVMLENGCEGTELGQTVAELGAVVRASGSAPERLGIVLDTCHLHVAGFDMATPDAPARLAAEIEAEGLAPYLTALHLNDAREPCGSHRDRHAPPGQGTIGEGLRRVMAHPLFAPLPAILEMSVPAAEQGIGFLIGP